MEQLTIWQVYPDLLLCGKTINEMTDEEIAKYLSITFNSNICFVNNLWVFKVKHTRVTAYKQNRQRTEFDEEKTVISIGIDCPALQRGSYFCVPSIDEAVTKIHEVTERLNREYKTERSQRNDAI